MTRQSSRRRRRLLPRGNRAAREPTATRHRGAPPSAPRRERALRPRSRRLSLSVRVPYAPPVSELLTMEEAQRLILERARPLAAEPVRLEEAAGRVLAEAARATVDLPPFPSSAMDGFAVRSEDTPGKLPIVARIAAGV